MDQSEFIGETPLHLAVIKGLDFSLHVFLIQQCILL